MIKVNRLYLCFTIAYVLFLTLIVLVANLGIASWVFSAVTLVPFGDKYCHLILMGLFSFLLNSSLHCQTISLSGVRILMGSMIVYLLVLAEELSQFWVVSRNVEAYDLLFDFIGIYLFGMLALRNSKMKAKKQFI